MPATASARRDPVRHPRQPAKPITGHIPPDLATAIRGPQQIDVSSIPVHRGPEVSVEARALGARAFTRGGEVYLPAEAGPLDTPKARGLLAHELVHAVQQRTLGATLPAEHTPAGQALEAAAVAAEAAHADPTPLRHPSLTQVIGQAVRTVGVQLAPVDAPAPPPAPVAEPPAMPTELDLVAESQAIRTLEEWTAPTAEDLPDQLTGTVPSLVDIPVGRSEQDQAMAEQILQVINVERTQAGEPTLNTLDANTMELIRRTIAEQAEDTAARSVIFAQAVAAGGAQPDTPASRPQVIELAAPLPQPVERVERVDSVVPQPVPVLVPTQAPAPVVAATDPSDQPIEIERLDLDQLTARLYDRLRNRIRMELLIDRERAGLLTDFR
ncbi:hypothetical protein GCM10027436_65880 [Actinophytocola sediminis]